MIVEFNNEKIEEVLYDFHKLTNITVSLWDTSFNQITYQPKQMPHFCSKIKSTPYGCKECLKSDIAILMECSTTKKPATHHCHAGLSDTVVPILWEDNIVGYIMFGQIRFKNSAMNINSIKEFAKKNKMDYNLLVEYYEKILPQQDDFLNSATRILNACANYIILSKMIKVNENFMPTKIDMYINNHIKEKITVNSICKDLFISKSKLYLIFKNNFSCTFGEYLLQKRIKIAKNLLCVSDMPIYEICNNIGVNDYNYFIKLFKKHTGLSPLAYRKSIHSF